MSTPPEGAASAPTGPRADVVDVRGWPVHRLASADLEVLVVPGKGCDVLSARPTGGPELLWSTPWGLRARGAASGGGDDATLLMEQYPGGWQTVFPHAGPGRTEHGAPWGMHGEAWLAPYDVTGTGTTATGAWITASTRLVRSPFTVTKRVEVDGATVRVSERVRHDGGHPVRVMWGQHPAFSPVLLGPRARLESSAGTVVVDPDRATPTGDLRPGARSAWPHAVGVDGAPVDLRPVPPEGSATDRLAVLTDFPAGGAWVRLADPDAGVAVDLRWDAELAPHAWYWFEDRATPGFPWWSAVRVLAVEPSTSWPGAREHPDPSSGGALTLHPGETRTHRVQLTATRIPPDPLPADPLLAAPSPTAPPERPLP